MTMRNRFRCSMPRFMVNWWEWNMTTTH